MLVDRLKEEGERVLDAVRAEGGTAIFLNLDLSAEEHAEQMVDTAVKTYGHLDIAINNAGVMGNPSPLHELAQEQMDYTNPAYVASKHAVNGLTKNLALDYARYGIRINSVNPAGTTTPMVAEAYEYVKIHREAAIKAGMDPAKAPVHGRTEADLHVGTGGHGRGAGGIHPVSGIR